MHYSSLHCTEMHFTTGQCISLHCMSLHVTLLNCPTLQCNSLHCTVHCTALHCALHCTAQHQTILRCTALRCRPTLAFISSRSSLHRLPTALNHPALQACLPLLRVLLLPNSRFNQNLEGTIFRWLLFVRQDSPDKNKHVSDQTMV